MAGYQTRARHAISIFELTQPLVLSPLTTRRWNIIFHCNSPEFCCFASFYSCISRLAVIPLQIRFDFALTTNRI